MKKYLKIISLILVVLLTVAFFVGCNNNNNVDPDDTQSDKSGTKYTVMTPDGAPSMAIAKMMKDNVSFGRKPSYQIIGSTAVAPSFTNGDADFIIAPTNAGIMMANKLKTYKMVAVTSWGNLYVVGDNSKKSLDECADANEFLAQFEGQSIASIGTNLVPDVTFNHILSTASVNAEFTASNAGLIQSDLADGNIQFGLLGEPAVTATLTKVKTAKRLCSVSDLWKTIVGTEFTQAGLFVKSSIIESDKEAVDNFLNELKASIEFLNSSEANAKALGDYMESTGNSTLKGAIVAKCYLQMSQKFVLAETVKDDVIAFARVLGVNVENADNLFYKA